MAGRALIREADLRRWAKIAREEHVTIHGRLDAQGGVSIHMTPATFTAIETTSRDLDARLDEFGAL
ncbi:hypothetical protein [uncultured Sphingomonas sp.]|uniref:hypothetical protein n=1 Tax=uncultured Sphingomonas sp. TaxID=158754 RepID=UPI0025E8EF54|nr:hypothetical protein [uncultured Sphingomonas sp.]